MPWPSKLMVMVRRDRVSVRGSTVTSTLARMGPSMPRIDRRCAVRRRLRACRAASPHLMLPMLLAAIGYLAAVTMATIGQPSSKSGSA